MFLGTFVCYLQLNQNISLHLFEMQLLQSAFLMHLSGTTPTPSVKFYGIFSCYFIIPQVKIMSLITVYTTLTKKTLCWGLGIP